MNILSMALKNFKKNFSFYTLYLFSISLVISVFFAFESFSLNTAVLGEISENGRVESMCRTVSVFLMAFVIFYMSYSNKFFLKRRTKELGIYALLGYRKSMILKILLCENLIICFLGFLAGLAGGGIIHKSVILLISSLLDLSFDNLSQVPFINLKAAGITALFILFVTLILVLSNAKFLFKTSLINLVRFEKKAEKKMTFKKFPAVCGFLMITAGYIFSLDILRGKKSIWITAGFYASALFTIVLIITGTVLFISSFLPFVLNKSRNNKNKFYTPLKIITVPNFVYRIRTNSKTLIMLALLSAAALSVSSVMGLSLYYPIAAVSRMAPSEIEFVSEDKSSSEKAENIMKKYGVYDDSEIIETSVYRLESSSENLPEEYSIGTSFKGKEKKKAREPGFECISYSEYVSVLKAQNKEKTADNISKLNDDECILIKYMAENDNEKNIGSIYSFEIKGKERKLKVKDTSFDNPFSFGGSVGTLIVSDSVYEDLKSSSQPLKQIVSINGKKLKNNENIYKELETMLGENAYLQGNSHRIHEIFSLSSPTFLLIGFLVILFFIAAGSILYFNNVSSVMDSKADYNILVKMGYNKKSIEKIIRKQTGLFFMIPFLLGLLDCIFASIVFKNGLIQNVLQASVKQYVPVIIAGGISAVIYIIYYLVTVKACCRAAGTD